MCYGNLDPKHALREMDDRLKSVAWQQDNATNDAAQPAFAPASWLRAAQGWLKRKDQANV